MKESLRTLTTLYKCLFIYFLLFSSIDLSAGIIDDFTDTRSSIRTILEKDDKKSKNLINRLLRNPETTTHFYNSRYFLPVWTDPVFTEAAIHFIEDSEKDGLIPEYYNLSRIKEIYPDQIEETRSKAIFDILLTDAILTYTSHLHSGKIENKEKYEWYIPKEAHNSIKVLRNLTVHKDFKRAYNASAPSDTSYSKLKDHLLLYRDSLANQNYKKIIVADKIEPGQSHEEMPKIRRRLIDMGDIERSIDNESLIYDSLTMRGVISFQQRHGLLDDGIIGKFTVEEFNKKMSSRIDQIIVNLERHRWMPDKIEKDRVVVNSANFMLQVYKDDKLQREKVVIVGKPGRSTPSFNAQMSYIVINPTWTIPPTILSDDVLPKVKQDVGYLSRNNMNVYTYNGDEVNPSDINWSKMSGKEFPYIIRQMSGPANPLGRIKFMFPNEYFIYIHDTPNKSLFELNKRDLSSGCIRVYNPIDLADYLLNSDTFNTEENWSAELIQEMIDQGDRVTIDFNKTISVYIMYVTCWVSRENKIQFREDFYKHDKGILQSIKGL